ncbi:DUF3618 domain-containing protein [Streptomyces nodosus]
MSDRMRGARGPGPALGAKGPDELRHQIEQTRSRLGDTVEELASKADVKGRAKARAAGLKDRAGAMTGQLRSSAAQAGHRAQEKASRASHTVQERRAAHARHAGHKHPGRAGRGAPAGAGFEEGTEPGTREEAMAGTTATAGPRAPGGTETREAPVGAEVQEEWAGEAGGTGPAGARGLADRLRSPRVLVAGGGTAAALATAGVLIQRGRARRRQVPTGPLQNIRSWGGQAWDKAPRSGRNGGTWSWGEQLRRNQARRGRMSWGGRGTRGKRAQSMGCGR